MRAEKTEKKEDEEKHGQARTKQNPQEESRKIRRKL
jgi:hypothetical protein